MKTLIQNLFLALAILASFNSQFSTAHAQGSGVIWTAGGASATWWSVASSADGTKLYAAGAFGGLWASTDSGVTWTARDSSEGWILVNCSADGTKLVASPTGVLPAFPVYTSTNSGMIFTQSANGPDNVTSLASSADGTKLAVASTCDIYTSADSGVNWVDQTESGCRSWSSIASSADGTKLVAVANGTYPVSGGWIYTSTDSGATWTPRDSIRNWQSVASSSNGNNLVAAVYNGSIYTSTDSGTNWTARDTSRTWQAVTSSADGTKLAAAVFNGPIYTSTDSGTNWTAGEIAPEFTSGYANTDTNINRGWRAIASSADGTKLVAVDYPGGGTNGLIYISGTLIVPTLKVFAPFSSPFSNNVAISWQYPSTGWTLQQNSNLTSGNWLPSSGVTNNGNVNYIITLPTGNMFYRLQLQQ